MKISPLSPRDPLGGGLRALHAAPLRSAPDPIDLPPPISVSAPLAKGAGSNRRDFLLAAALVGCRMLPPPAGLAVGLGTGTLATVTGFGAMREGARRGNPHEVLDGAAHVASGALLGTAALAGQGPFGDQAVVAAFTVLGAKQVWDRPIATVWDLSRETASMTRDAMRVLTDEDAPATRSGAHASGHAHGARGWEASIWDME